MTIDLAKLKSLLDELRADSDEVNASALVSRDGLMLAADIANPQAEDRLAAMSAAVLSLGGRMSTELLDGSTERVMIKSKGGYIVVTQVAEQLLLTVMARADAKLGMVFHHIEKLGGRLADELS